MTVAEQGRVFLAMLLIGAGLGGVLQAILLLCCLTRAGAVLRSAAELLFGVVCAGAIAAGALVMRTEAFRWYVFAGTLAGMLLYGATIGAAVHLLLGRMCRFVKKGEIWVQKRKNRAGN